MWKRLTAGVTTGLAVALALAAQTAAPSLDKEGLEAYFRHLRMWPPNVEVTISDPPPAPLAVLYRSDVHGTLGMSSRDEPFYVSGDS